METEKIIFEGAEVHFAYSGNIKNRAIVFLHGNSLSSSTFKNQFGHLNRPTIVIDLPGHGQSAPAKNPETYSIPGYAKAVRHIISKLGVENFILVGHSLGGHVAMSVAAELKSASGLLIFGTPPLDSVSSLGSAFLPNPLMPLLFQDNIPEDQALQLAESMLLQNEHANALKKDILATDPRARSSFAAFVGKGIIKDEVAIIKSLNFPVAILHGESDSFINGAYVEGIGFTNLWQNKIHSIKDSGHCPQVEQHHDFNTLLTDYYKAVFN